MHWITLYVNCCNVTYYENFVVEHLSKEIKKFIGNKSIITIICRMQGYDSTMCGYFCIGFADFMLRCKNFYIMQFSFLNE